MEQKLRSKNLKAAKNVALILRRYKAISLREFKDIWCDSKGWKVYYRGVKKTPGQFFSLSYNYVTTIRFLREQGLVTIHKINNTTFLVATQKCIRGKLDMF